MMHLRRGLLASLLASATQGDEDIGYELLFQTAKDEFSGRCCPASKPLPSWAKGDFVIGSVGLQEMGDRHFVGFLDAFGKYNKFTLQGDQVCATYRIMQTGFYNESVKANTIGPGLLFYETAPPRHCPALNPLCNLPPMAPNDNTFVNTFMHGGELLTVTDSPYMLRMDPETLEVKGTKTWKDKVQSSLAIVGSAHPLKRSSGEFIDFVGNLNPVTGHVDMRVYGISDEHPDLRDEKVNLEMTTSPYMHSFGMTDKYVVLPRMPIKFGLPIGKGMSEAFSDLEIKEPGPNNAFHVLPLNGDKPIVVPLPVDEPLYYIHHANTFENASGLVIDLTTSPFNAFSSDLTSEHEVNKTFRDSCYHAEKRCLNLVKRFVIPLDGKSSIRSEAISDPETKTDFVKINENFKGKKHCFYWGIEWFADKKSKASMAVTKYDTCSAGDVAATKKKWTRKNWYPSEAFMIPDTGASAGEDDGLLVFTALDGSKGETWLITANAKTMETYSEAGPFPRIAFTTHGEFYPSHGDKVLDTGAMYV
eukprot:TRINITY_DN27023_c0_g1_i1.p1 TRINITY_DN27023_c0_g1~~TRINITY_DN27023_c0_g1_i1.p1  ORF type:complete len:532 (-),score=95.92 TRINITY_DN27023_c0_g1_i1:123-1718(-)